ncbi:MAG: hypothetical protein WC803_12835 [Sphingomonas sp.]|jgi:hypothetical protein
MIEKHVTSLALSKKLKELGVKQESEFYHYKSNHSIMKSDIGEKFWYLAHKDSDILRNCERVSAFLSSELREMLKKAKYSELWEAYQFHKGNTDGFGQIIMQSLSADFLSKMLIYLIENSIIDVKSL